MPSIILPLPSSHPIIKFMNKITLPLFIFYFSNNVYLFYMLLISKSIYLYSVLKIITAIMNVKEKFGPCRVNLDILESRKKPPNRTTLQPNLFSQETNRKQ